MKSHPSPAAKGNNENPVRENQPHSISDGLKQTDLNDYPFTGKAAEGHAPEEFIDPANNTSHKKDEAPAERPKDKSDE